MPKVPLRVSPRVPRSRRPRALAHDRRPAGLRPSLRHRTTPGRGGAAALSASSCALTCCSSPATSRSAPAPTSSREQAPSSTNSACPPASSSRANHDIPLFDMATRLFSPYRRFAPGFSGRRWKASSKATSLLIVALNTTRRWRHTDGEVSDDNRIARVGARLARAGPQQLRLVAVHQPVGVTKQVDVKNLLHGHERAVRHWAEAGADCRHRRPHPPALRAGAAGPVAPRCGPFRPAPR